MEAEQGVPARAPVAQRISRERIERSRTADFYDLRHRKIYNALLEIGNDGHEAIDLLAGSNRLKDGNLDPVGGALCVVATRSYGRQRRTTSIS